MAEKKPNQTYMKRLCDNDTSIDKYADIADKSNMCGQHQTEEEISIPKSRVRHEVRKPDRLDITEECNLKQQILLGCPCK